MNDLHWGLYIHCDQRCFDSVLNQTQVCVLIHTCSKSVYLPKGMNKWLAFVSRSKSLGSVFVRDKQCWGPGSLGPVTSKNRRFASWEAFEGSA